MNDKKDTTPTTPSEESGQTVLRKKETARIKIKDVESLTEGEIERIFTATYQVGEVLKEIKEKNKYSNSKLVEISGGILANVETVSRLMNHAEKRAIPVEVLFFMRCKFGIDLNALVDGADPRPTFPSELYEQLLHWASEELDRRNLA